MKDLAFHHITIASSNIEKEYDALKMIGYVKEDMFFDVDKHDDN